MMIKWGIIGAGGIAYRRTIPEIISSAENSTIHAVMDVDTLALARVKNEFNIPNAYTSEKELLDDKAIDAVYIASPNNCHFFQVIEAASRGKHILCEKPIAGTIEQAEQMINACNKAGVLFGINFCMRLNPYNQKSREIVCSGQLGQIVHGRAQLTCWYPPIKGAWRQNINQGYGGAFMDMGCHCVDLLENIFCDYVVAVLGVRSSLIHNYEPEDFAIALLEFSRGESAIVDVSFAIPDEASKNVLEIYGTKGSLIAEGSIGQTATGIMTARISLENGVYEAKQNRKIDEKIVMKKIELDGPPLYGEMIRLFADAIIHGDPFIPNGETGLHNLRVVLGLYESTTAGKKIAV